MNSELIENTILFVKETLKNAEGGHDWFHIERVWKNAKLIAKSEDVDIEIVEVAALLHDIADSKFNGGDEKIGPKKALDFLIDQDADYKIIDHVIAIIENVSFKGGNHKRTFNSIELDVVQDADRLDALGAIGIARTSNNSLLFIGKTRLANRLITIKIRPIKTIPFRGQINSLKALSMVTFWLLII